MMVFCHTTTWINIRYTYNPFPLETPSHLCPLPTPSHCHRALASQHHTLNSHWLSILHMVIYMFQCYSLKSSHPLLPLLCPKVCSLCLCLLCCPWSLVLSFEIIIYMLIFDICLSLTSLYMIGSRFIHQNRNHQALPSLGFSRQEHWSRLPFPSPMHEGEKWKWSRSVVSDS